VKINLSGKTAYLLWCCLKRRGVQRLVQYALGLRLESARQLVERVAELVKPAALLARRGPHLAQRRPEPERAVTDGQHGARMPRSRKFPQRACSYY
jgi:hypothetical protein